jgi:hypothetical protein
MIESGFERATASYLGDDFLGVVAAQRAELFHRLSGFGKRTLDGIASDEWRHEEGSSRNCHSADERDWQQHFPDNAMIHSSSANPQISRTRTLEN